MHESAVKALLAAKADVHAKNEVRVGEGAVRARGVRRGDCVVLLWFRFGFLNLRLLKDPIREPQAQAYTQNPDALNVSVNP